MLLKSTFWAFKKSGTSCPNWGRGGGGLIWTKSKREAAFFGNPAFPYYDDDGEASDDRDCKDRSDTLALTCHIGEKI